MKKKDLSTQQLRTIFGSSWNQYRNGSYQGNINGTAWEIFWDRGWFATPREGRKTVRLTSPASLFALLGGVDPSAVSNATHRVFGRTF